MRYLSSNVAENVILLTKCCYTIHLIMNSINNEKEVFEILKPPVINEIAWLSNCN